MAEKSARTLIDYLHQVVAPTASDRDLLAQFVEAQDEAAFAAIVRWHGSTVWSICRRILNNEVDAEDAFQATFVVLAREAGRLRPPYALSAWLYGVARRVSLKARGRILRQRRTLPVTEPSSGDPLDVLTARELLNTLDAELLALPEEYRSPLILCCLEGKSREEAAEQLGWTPGSVKGRLERGRDLLAQRLARKGIPLPAALGAVLVWKTTASATPAVGLSGVGLSATVLALAREVTFGSLGWVGRALAVGLVLGSLGVGGVMLVQQVQPVPPQEVGPSPIDPPAVERVNAPAPVAKSLSGQILKIGDGRVRFQFRESRDGRETESPQATPRDVQLTDATRFTWLGETASVADLHTEQRVSVTLTEDERTALAVEIVTPKRVRKPGGRDRRADKGWLVD